MLIYFSARATIVNFQFVFYAFILLFRRATLYPTTRRNMSLYIVFQKKKKKKKKKMTHGLPWVKISKLCHNPIVHFPREREGYLMAKNPSILVKIQYGLTVTKLHLSKFKSPTFSVKCSTA